MQQWYSLSLLESALNHALQLDPYLPPQLQAFDRKVVQIIIQPLQISFYMRFYQQRIELWSEYDHPADVMIYSSPLGLIRLSVLPASQARSLFNQDIQMEGDVALGQAIKQVMDSMQIDWEGHLARFTGDRVAYQMGRVARGLKHRVQNTLHSLKVQSANYINEEIHLGVGREEVEDFCQDVDDLRLDVERLEARVHWLQAKKEGA